MIYYVCLHCVALLHCFGFYAIGNTGLTFSKKTLFFLKAKFFQKARCRDQMRKALGKIGGLQKRERTRRGILLFVWYKISIAPEVQMKPRRLCLFLLVQNKHSTRSANEASEAMLIFVIMGGQWMDGFFGEPSARAVNSPPSSCYKDSIEQVAPAMPRARHEPI